jgi:hypothetical protein
MVDTAHWDRHVTAHSDLTQLDERLWEVTATLPRGSMTRNMTIYRLNDGGLLIHGAHALRAETLAAVEALGELRLMIVASTLHEMHETLYQARYPDLATACPAAVRAKLQRHLRIDAAIEDIGAGLGITVLSPDGIKPIERSYELPLREGVALVFGDMLMNLPHFSGFEGWLLRSIGSTGFFGMTGIGRLLLLKNRASFRLWLAQMADRPDLRIISVGHGATIRSACGNRLKEATARL